jgi:hypothetical protein
MGLPLVHLPDPLGRVLRDVGDRRAVARQRAVELGLPRDERIDVGDCDLLQLRRATSTATQTQTNKQTNKHQTGSVAHRQLLC